jgi:4-diphosphocytidyl-2-C-methyl-D-erythritol kinase
MAKVNWSDEILIQRAKRPGIELICKGPYWAPAGKENLIFQAAKLILKSSGTKANLKITLTKNIPAGSGLGSGSSDAAATLIGLNRYLDLDLKRKDLAKLAAKLGSDVPFFLNGPLAFCKGKGEKVKKLRKVFNFLALIILPDVSVSTKKAYANYRHNPAIYYGLSAQINEYILKNRIDLVAKMCANMLQTSCFGLAKNLARLKEKIESLGIRPLRLTGSGSGIFYIIENRDLKTAGADADILKKKLGCTSVIVSNNRW